MPYALRVPRLLPCSVSRLVHDLAEPFAAPEQARFWELARVVEGLFHHYGSCQARLAEELYEAFDPDRGALLGAPRPWSDPAVTADPAGDLERLMHRFGRLLTAANFTSVDPAALMRADDREVLLQLNIDPDVDALESLAVFVRGAGTKAITLRPASKLFRLVEREVPTYSRVLVVVRTRGDPSLFLKLFKDVPHADLELLLPTVRVKMKLLDKLKLTGSSGAAALSAWKLLRLAYRLAPGLAKLFAVPFKLVLLPVALVVGGIYGGKTLLDYTKIRASYVTALAEHLYAITLASNRAAVSRLAVMAGEEEAKEVLLAYRLLQAAPRPGLTIQALREQAGAFARERYGVELRFDAEDAVAKLEDLDLIWTEDGRLNAVSVEAALRKVDEAWDDLYIAPTRAEERLARQRRLA